MSDKDLKVNDVVIAWNNLRENQAIIGVLSGIAPRYEISNSFGYDNAIKWDGTQKQYDHVRSYNYTTDKMREMFENDILLKIDGKYHKISEMVCPHCEEKMSTISISSPSIQPVIVHGQTYYEKSQGLLVMECLYCRTKFTYHVDDIKKAGE